MKFSSESHNFLVHVTSRTAKELSSDRRVFAGPDTRVSWHGGSGVIVPGDSPLGYVPVLCNEGVVLVSRLRMTVEN
jgi:hypothetical protein